MRTGLAFAVVALVAACIERPMVAPTTSTPQASISDARHESGNAHFYFLPPLVPDPAATGTFDGTLLPYTVVEICRLDPTGCTPIANFSANTSTACGPKDATPPAAGLLRVAPDDQLYIVNWDTGECGALDREATYRIRVLVAGTELGHADVDVVASGRDLRNVNTGAYVGLVDGRTLPIKFRIEQGAVTVVGPAGGSVIGGGGQLEIDFSPASVSQAIGVIVRRLQDESDPDLVPGTMFDIQPEGIVFASDVHLEIRYDPQLLGPDADQTLFRLEHFVGEQWSGVEGSVVDPTSAIVSAVIPGFSRWRIGVFRGGVPPTGPWRQVTAGEEHTCGLTTDNRVFCWGRGVNGQLGTGDFNDRLEPSPVFGSRRFLQVDAGSEHTCALEIRTGGELGWPAYCWGQNIWGQLGLGFLSLTGNFGISAPIQVLGDDQYTSINAGGVTTCGVNDVLNFTRCWGSGATLPYDIAPEVPFFRVTVGGNTQPGTRHACGIAYTGDLYCWGYIFTPWSSPRVVAGGFLGTGPGRLTSGALHACGIPTGDSPAPDQINGAIYCLGENDHGQLGDGTTASSPTPVEVRGGPGRYSWVSAGYSHTCAVAADRSAYCWGDNSSGQLGQSGVALSLAPIPVSGNLRFAQIASGDEHVCGLTTEGAIYCWGSNSSGQLGNGTRLSSAVPILVPAPH